MDELLRVVTRELCAALASMHEHGVRVLHTRNTDFHRRPFLEAHDPLR